jgi:hypothetical protein
MLPQNFSVSDLTLFYKNVGSEQSIYINGKDIAHNVKIAGGGPALQDEVVELFSNA